MRMKQSFGFFTTDIIRRTKGVQEASGLSPNLRRRLLARADERMREWLDALGLNTSPPADVDALLAHIEHAREMELFSRGGVPVRNFVVLALTNYYLRPHQYIESGYYRGCSIFAAFFNPLLESVIGLDPVVRHYRITSAPPGVNVDLRQSDFSDLVCDPAHSLVYFDDHINTAQRIVQCAQKGFHHVIFDDSCGVTGVTQRKWPSMPSLFFIMNVEQIQEGDSLTWYWRPPPVRGLRDLWRRPAPQTLTCVFDAETLELCRRARDCIETVEKLPDLSDFVTEVSAPSVDTSQHFVVLRS